jgi:hypothetical protein|tara:strand:+ start:1050 stop:1202 length:153 start_codon:yes stop_codon:yes gene_type:complete
MIREKIKKGLKTAGKYKDFIQTTSVAIVLALIIVSKSQRLKNEYKKNTTK